MTNMNSGLHQMDIAVRVTEMALVNTGLKMWSVLEMSLKQKSVFTTAGILATGTNIMTHPLTACQIQVRILCVWFFINGKNIW